MHRPLIIANWKSHKTEDEAFEWLKKFRDEMSLVKTDAEIVIAPSFPLVPLVSDFLFENKLPNVVLGVQDMSSFPAGSYTGAVSAMNVEGFEVSYALVGHSERRRYFHETNQDVANKVDQALSAKITPVVCVDADYIESQASALEKSALSRSFVAYEPLEAIGSGNFQPIWEVQEVVAEIRRVFGKVPIMYGGSVSADNVAEYLQVVDGVLVGSNSLDVGTFVQLLKAAA